MIDVDFMKEEEFIEILNNEKILEQILQNKVMCYYEGDERPLKLSYLLEKVSPNKQNEVLKLNIDKLGSLLLKKAKSILDEPNINKAEKNKKIYYEVYVELIKIFDKLSIQRAKELVQNESIKNLLFNTKIDGDILKITVTEIKKPSVIRIILEQIKDELIRSENEKKHIKEIKTDINNTIKSFTEYSPSKIHFDRQYQGLVLKEKALNDKIKLLISVKGYAQYRLTQTIKVPAERKEEKEKQQNLEAYYIILEMFKNNIDYKPFNPRR